MLRRLHAVLTMIAAGALCCTFSGCGSSTPTVSTPPPPTGFPGASFTGKAMTGKQAFVGAAVQLYAAGTTGNGSAPTSLLTSPLVADASGAFTVPASYSCPTAASQLYLVARGGPFGTPNSSTTLLAPVGTCQQVVASAQFTVNEVTTVASAWALSQFLSSGANIGATSTNEQGLANAFATAANLANPSTGTALGAGFPKTGVSPAAKINSLANLLSACTSSSVLSVACSNLVFATNPGAPLLPSDTLDAVLRIVRNPGENVAAIYGYSNASSTFTPALTAAPADWTLFISYTGGGMALPSSLGVDSTGNIWVASYGNTVGGGPPIGAVSEFTPTGSPVFPNGISGDGLSECYGLAIDAQNNVWVTNQQSPTTLNSGLGSASVFNSSGQPVSGVTGYTAGGLNYPAAIAIDTNADAWVVDFGNSHLTLLSNSGAPLSGTAGYTSDSFAFPLAVAVDGNHNAWIGDQNDTVITRVSSDGTQFLKVSCCDGPDALAIDQLGNVWVANFFGDSISEVSSTGAVLSSGYSDNKASIDHPQGVAIDGAGNVWISNFRGPSITELAGAAAASPGQILSPTAGYAPDAKLLEAYDIAIDASGNLWVTSFGDNILTEFVGLATPIKTPQIGLPQTP
jgi:streptogramin lyase